MTVADFLNVIIMSCQIHVAGPMYWKVEKAQLECQKQMIKCMDAKNAGIWREIHLSQCIAERQ
jgi:hypothetical protein